MTTASRPWPLVLLAATTLACGPGPQTKPTSDAPAKTEAPAADAKSDTGEPKDPAPAKAVEPSPSMTLDQVGLLGLDGRPVELKAARKPVTVIALWALWCKPCMEELPQLDKYRAQLLKGGADDVAFLAVSIDGEDAREKTAAKVKELGLEMTVALDASQALIRGPLSRPDSSGKPVPVSLPQLIVADGQDHVLRACGYNPDKFESKLDEIIQRARAGLTDEVEVSGCVAPPPTAGGSIKFKLPKKTPEELKAFRPELEKMILGINPTLKGEALAEVIEYAEGQITRGEMIVIKRGPAPDEDASASADPDKKAK